MRGCAGRGARCGECRSDDLSHDAKTMHYVSFLAVEAEDQEDAFRATEAFLTEYEGYVYDWYVIGGRWKGACNGDDLICAADGRSAFDDVVARAVAARDQHFNDVRQHLFGPDARVAPKPTERGEVDEAHDAYIERIWESYRETSEELRRLANNTSVPVAHGYSLIGYYMRQFAETIGGAYNSNSYFYDTVAHTNTTEALYERVSAKPEQQWIVVVDLHN